MPQEEEKKHSVRREKFRDMVFTRQFSAFDRQNQEAANNTFHGFYTLFWIALVFLLVKMGAENWRKTGRGSLQPFTRPLALHSQFAG